MLIVAKPSIHSGDLLAVKFDGLIHPIQVCIYVRDESPRLLGFLCSVPTNKKHATARGLQLPICSLDPLWQQPIAAQQVLNDHGKPNETAEVSLKMM